MLRNRTFYYVVLFILAGVACEYGLWHTKSSDVLLVLMSPVLSFAQFLESKIPVLKLKTALQSELALVLPLTLLYFGGAGYWLCQIAKEEGFLKYFILICFISFLAVIHWQSYIYLYSLLSSTSAS